MSDDAIPPPPAGFVLSEGRGPFSTLNGPYFHREGEGETVAQAFYALARHTNGVGIVHGGMLSAFMDGLLAGAAGRGTGKLSVTIHLSMGNDAFIPKRTFPHFRAAAGLERFCRLTNKLTNQRLND